MRLRKERLLLLRRLANFIAERRLLVVVVLIAVSALCALQIPNVSVVADQSAYLSEDPSIRTGLEIIEAEFPEIAHEARSPPWRCSYDRVRRPVHQNNVVPVEPP